MVRLRTLVRLDLIGLAVEFDKKLLYKLTKQLLYSHFKKFILL